MDFVSAFAGYDQPLVIALSGGADSAVAAWAARQAGREARCVHVDHGLDGSPVMRQAATAIAEQLEIELKIVTVDVRSPSETDLRDARYAALLASLIDDELLVTAHTADDTVETVLINLLRGTGVDGLAGIPAARDRVVRPLLAIPGGEVREAAEQHGLPFVDDPENESSAHLRNRVRHDLLPYLESDFQPALRQVLGRLASAASDASQMIERQVSAVPMERSTGRVRCPLGRLSGLTPGERRHVYRRMLTAVRGPTAPSAAEIDRIEACFLGHGRAEFDGTDAIVHCQGPWLVIGIEDVRAPATATHLSDGSRWGAFRFRFDEDASVAMLSRWQMVSPREALEVRSPRPSDTISMRDGSKEVYAAISERGFQPSTHPVVVDATDAVVWIPGVRHRWVGTSFSQVDTKGYLVVVADRERTWAPFVR